MYFIICQCKLLGIHDSSISDDIVAGFIPFFHRAVSNVKAGNQYIHFFFDFGDILGVESSYSIGTSKNILPRLSLNTAVRVNSFPCRPSPA